MSRILGNPVHQAYVYPDFDAALARFAAAGIGPFWTMQTGGLSRYRGELHEMKAMVAFTYTGDTCFEIMAPNGAPRQQSTYDEFLRRNPHGGLHHIAYWSADFDETLALCAAEGKALRVVQELTNAAGDFLIEVYCEPVGVDNPVMVQLIRPGLFDPWFDAMKQACAGWDGTDPVREARPLMMAAMAAARGA